MSRIFKGNAWKYGDNIDTDVIIPARHLVTSDEAELGKHCMEDIDKDFVKKVAPGDMIVGGENFGCGSSREHAPIAIKGAGCSCVIAASYARIFFRNAINIGLPILECPAAAAGISDGDEVDVDLSQGIIYNRTQNTQYQAVPLPDFVLKIAEAGGLVNFLRSHDLEELTA